MKNDRAQCSMVGAPSTIATMGVTILFLVSCASDTSDTGPHTARVELKSESATVATYRVRRSDTSFAERGRKLASVFLGKELPELPKASFVDPTDGSIVWRDVGNEPGVMLSYTPDLDDLEIRDVTRETDYSGLSALPFMPRSRAEPIYMEKLSELEAAGLVEMASLDMDSLLVGTTEVGAGALGEEPQPPEIIDYRFKVKRLIGEFQIRNSLVRVSVTRKGEVGSIRILRGGIDLIPEAMVARAVDESSCTERFNSEYPKAAILHHGTGYFVPKPFTEEAVLEPQCYFSFSEKYDNAAGTIITRRKGAHYSVLLADADPQIFGGPDKVDEQSQ